MTAKKVKKKREKNPLREQTKNRCIQATWFVNTNDEHLEHFAKVNKLRPGMSLKVLKGVGIVLRQAWDKDKWDAAETSIEQILADYKREIEKERIAKLEALGGIGPITQGERESPFEHPAFRLRMGHEEPVFEPRDALDKIAYTILQAASLGQLKMCEGHRRGWDCRTPYLVAHEGRKRFCYDSCEKRAKAEAKKNPKKGRSK